VAHSDEPPSPPKHVLAADTSGANPAAKSSRQALALLGAALAVCLLAYLVPSVPGAWFPSAAPKGWTPRDFVLARGTGGLEANEFVITAGDASGGALVTVETDFRSADYPVIAWIATDVPDQADAHLIWRSDYAPARINSAALAIASGRLLPVALARDPNWVGRIRGLGLAINGSLPQPVHIREVAAKPMGAIEVGGDRVREWLAFEGFSGSSINNVTGGADVQSLPLPLLVATSMALAALVWFGFARRTRHRAALPAVVATLFVAGWLLADTRWAWDLARQVRATARLYAGLDWRERHLAAEDGSLFAFIEAVRAKLPAVPVRVFMSADAHYFRGRGAYHLVVVQRRNVQFDPATGRLRWDGGEPVAAELLLTAPGAALFRIR
jgi:hypothetical protein